MSCQIYGQVGKKMLLGAYYFDGWTGTYPYHITQSLKDSFPEREPKWGWITSTKKYMNQQLKIAHKSGLDFFSYCWYFSNANSYPNEPLNNALKLFLDSNQKKMKFTILVANHKGFEIKNENWDFVCNEWIKYFLNKQYLKIDDKPIITFLSLQTLLDNLGGEQGLQQAFSSFREKARLAGIGEISIALCTDFMQTQIAEKVGFDLITGYNYHKVGFVSNTKVIPIDSLINKEKFHWNKIIASTKLKYIPVTTLNWDPRPWANGKNSYTNDSRYLGYSVTSVFKSIKGCIDWIKVNRGHTIGIGLIYAWNENGEGAWLTPGKNGFNPSIGLKKAVLEGNR